MFVFYKMHKFNPSMLKPALIKTELIPTETTYNWDLILSVIVACGAFAAAILATSNVVIFLFSGIWLINVRSVVVIAIVFMLFALKEFDKFVRKILK